MKECKLHHGRGCT